MAQRALVVLIACIDVFGPPIYLQPTISLNIIFRILGYFDIFWDSFDVLAGLLRCHPACCCAKTSLTKPWHHLKSQVLELCRNGMSAAVFPRFRGSPYIFCETMAQACCALHFVLRPPPGTAGTGATKLFSYQSGQTQTNPWDGIPYHPIISAVNFIH